jgi:CheY-specific phosphatase CheX
MIKAMKASIFEVLEQMFFMPIDVVDAESEKTPSPHCNGQTYVAKVEFDGPAPGIFRLEIPTALAASIAADFLGAIEEELSVEEITGTVKEMLNMLAGNSLSAYDPQSCFNLQVPVLIEPSADAGAFGDKRETIDMGIETMDHNMSLRMSA